MRSKFTFLPVLILLFCLIPVPRVMADSISLGYIINKTGNDNLNYLEKILPNSIASSLKNKYNIDITKPGQLSFLMNKDNPENKLELKDEDMFWLDDELDTDYFAYGYFSLLENNRIKLIMNIFKKDTRSIFSFEETGYLETEMFRFIDKISAQIKNITSESMIYKGAAVTPKSKFSIITNLSGEELNCLYYEFLAGGYRISSTQGNELYNIVDDDNIQKLYHVSGINASYHIIDNRKDIDLMFGAWSGKNSYKKIMEDKKTFEQYAFNFSSTYNDFLKKLKAFDNDSTDYLIIIGFDDDRTNAWIRCVSIKDNRLLITESGIEGSSINEIAKKILNSITTGLPSGR